jgi:bifunctional DNase/RNase
MFKRMTVSSLVMDPQTNTPIVILKDPSGEHHLPIWIGLLEATSIATQLEKINFPRPMTHDLMKNVFDRLNVTVERVEVCDLRDNTYYALIHLKADGETSRIDARPSDAIAIALRTDAPIYVNEEVLQKSAHRAEQVQPVFRKEDKEKISEILEQMDPEDFSKYKM